MDSGPSRRNDSRVVIHFDYDCFYASVFEHENPALKVLPLAVQQKQIIVTCNYEARRRGLRKLQLISDARRICPDVVIVLGEELGRFRDASKTLYNFLESFTWSGKVERLGFDEVFMDVSDIIDYNQALLNPYGLARSFFQLMKNDPTIGFEFDASWIASYGYPPDAQPPPVISTDQDTLTSRLILGSHLAQYLRVRLEEEKGYSATVGISTNKLIAKLVGNLNKPRGQTTLLPPYVVHSGCGFNDIEGKLESNVTRFIDSHEIGKIPGIGSKMAQRIRNHVLSRAAHHGMESRHEWTKDSVTIKDVRQFPDMGSKTLEHLLSGPGMERGIGGKVWNLINGVDDTDVQQMRRVPLQISIEDSYIRLDTMSQVLKEMRTLSTSLINRMHTDLLEDDEDPELSGIKRWIAYPKTVRLSTRPRLPLNTDGTRTRTFNRISKSMPIPHFVFNLKDDVAAVAERLVQETLIPIFRRLHPQTGWNLSLLNVCVTNLVEVASEDSASNGRDIGKMFKRQETVLKLWKVEDKDVPPDSVLEEEPRDQAEPSAGDDAMEIMEAFENISHPTQNTISDCVEWEDDDEESDGLERCGQCGASLPGFAMPAHDRFHTLER